MSEFYVAKGHRYEAEVTESGYGSRIVMDGVEMPEVKAFRIEATVDSASLSIDVVAIAKVKGVVDKVQVSGTAHVLTDSGGNPVGVYLEHEDAVARLRSALRDGIDLNYFRVPIEARL